MENHSYRSLLFSISRALWGEITSSFRGVAVEWKTGQTQKEDIIFLYFYIDDPINQDLHDDCTSIGAEVIADYSEGGIEEHVIELNYPNPLPKHCHWAFRRHEDLPFEKIDSVDYESFELSILYCLLGNIFTYMRGVATEINPQSSSILFFISGDLDKEKENLCEKITNHVRKLNPSSTILMKLFRKDYPERLNFRYREFKWIYLPKEYPSPEKAFEVMLWLCL